MSARSPAEPAALPALPHWEQPPPDLPDAISQVKTALRARIAASGRTVEQVMGVVERQLRADVAEIAAAGERGETVWPVISYADIEAGTVPAAARELLRRRGCLVVRGHFDRDQALGWDRDIVRYVDENGFFASYRGPGDEFFASVGSTPEIYPVYWSAAQMQARQSDRMARVQAFLNSLWKHDSRRRAVVRPGARFAVSGPDSAAAAGHGLRRARRPPRSGLAGPVDDTVVPERVPAPVRRQRGAV